MAKFILTKEEIKELTGERSIAKQMESLAYLGMEFRRRPDGALLVLRSHAEKILCNQAQTNVSLEDTPNFEAVFNA